MIGAVKIAMLSAVLAAIAVTTLDPARVPDVRPSRLVVEFEPAPAPERAVRRIDLGGEQGASVARTPS